MGYELYEPYIILMWRHGPKKKYIYINGKARTIRFLLFDHVPLVVLKIFTFSCTVGVRNMSGPFGRAPIERLSEGEKKKKKKFPEHIYRSTGITQVARQCNKRDRSWLFMWKGKNVWLFWNYYICITEDWQSCTIYVVDSVAENFTSSLCIFSS